MAGIGKTALAVHVAHRLRDRFPDGHLYLDLRAHTAGAEPVETVEALDFLLRSIGVPLSRIPDGVDERAALWRTELARLRVLIVLDNAAGADQVRPLLPGTGDCFVLITSRRRLAVLEGGHSLFLDLLPRADATALFIAVAGARAAAEPDAVAEVVELCGRLPLAIRVAAARMRSRPQWTVADLADRLRRQTRLNELSTGDRGVRAALDLSYQDLGTDERHLFRRLGLHPGEHFDAYCAAALAGIPLETADALLESLLDMHLLMPQTSDRYRFHDLIREYAVAVDDSSAGERRSALDRLFDYYLHTVNLTRELIEPVRRHIDTVVVHKPAVVPPLSDAPGALAWLDAERANLVAAVHHAAHHGWPVHAWQLVCDLRAFHVRRGSVEEIRAAYRAAERGARATHDVWAQAELANNLGGLILLSGRHHEAMASCRRGLELFRLIDDRYGVAGTLNNIGGVLTDLKRPEEAIEHFRQSQVFFEEIGDAYGQAAAIGNTGDCLTDLERYPEALDHFGRSLEILRGLGHRRGEASVWGMIGRAHRAMKEYDQAIAANERARAICQEIGDRHSEALRLVALGELHRDRGDPVRARDCFDEAIGISQWSAGCAAEARAHEGIGDLEAAAGDHAAAEVRWRQAMELYSELYDPKAAELAARLDALDPS